MESDDDGFAQKGGEPLDMGADFDDSDEDPDDDDEDLEPTSSKPQALSQANTNKAPQHGQKPEDIKGQKIDNQPFDLAVDVNDSEEIESEEEEDRMNVDMQV